MEWGEDNHAEFDDTKNEIIAFTRKRKPVLKKRIAEVRFTVRGYIIGFNTKGTRWLGVYLDTGLQYRVYNNHILKKDWKAEDTVWHLAATKGLVLVQVQRIQVAVVEAVTLYRAEVW